MLKKKKETCNINQEDMNNPTMNDKISCYIIDGRLSLYYSSIQSFDSTLTSDDNIDNDDDRRKNMLQSIQQIMDNGQLDDSHPAIISVKFRNTTMDELENIFNFENDDGNFDIDGNMTPLDIMNTTSWIALGASLATLIMLLLTRYKYYANANRRQSNKGTGSATSDDAFFEIDGSIDEEDDSRYMDQFDMVSSLTMTKSGTLSGSSPSSPIFHKSIIRSSPFSSKESKKSKGRRNRKTWIKVKGIPPESQSKKNGSNDIESEESSKSYIDSVQSEVRKFYFIVL